MRPLRLSTEIELFWTPLAGSLALTALAGGQIHRASDMPAALTPAFLLCGALLVLGAVVGIFEPAKMRHWLRPSSVKTWRTGSQHLFALIFGCLLVVWAATALLCHVLELLVHADALTRAA